MAKKIDCQFTYINNNTQSPDMIHDQAVTQVIEKKVKAKLTFFAFHAAVSVLQSITV